MTGEGVTTLPNKIDNKEEIKVSPEDQITYRADKVGVTFPTAQGSIQVLEDVSFDVAPGEIIAIVGRSGTGKSTLLRVLSGLESPTVGTITLDGEVIDGPRASTMTVFQDYTNALLPWRTVEKNVALGLERIAGKAERHKRVKEALRLVDLEDFSSEYPWRLSGGMQQRVQIARALAMKPQVLLMDEPFGALDALTKVALQNELLEIHNKTQPTIIFITHDIEEAIYLSDRVFVISGAPGAGRPGTLSQQTEVALPRPRNVITTREDPEYLRLRHTLIEALQVTNEDIGQ